MKEEENTGVTVCLKFFLLQNGRKSSALYVVLKEKKYQLSVV